ncbi:MAG: thioredoxin-disulfide reductase [Verrucomicrobia bacterium]|nr:thioredoxin-disulfide reductase [Verrucomicrobiota bacterium]
MRDVVILGSGCAGWTSALYLARANLKPLVLTGAQMGGLLTTTSIVENFPGFPQGVDGTTLMAQMMEQAQKFGAEVEFGVVAEEVTLGKPVHRIRVGGKTIETRALIVATGAGHRHLGVPGEKELKGVTYCATCDGALPMFRNQPLVVVGGGDSACEEATFLTRFASKVYLVHRRGELRASRIMAERALGNAKIEPVWNSVVESVEGVKEGKVTGVKLKDMATGKSSALPCAGVFIAVGHVPNTQIFQGKLKMDEAGYLQLGPGSRTNREGVFGAGDCADKVYRQAITAAGMGCMAAIDAERYLAG